MEEKILNFLKNHRVCALSVLLADGSPHTATMHYSHTENPFNIFIQTEKTSRKCEALLDGNSVKSSFVVGFSEEEWITLQMDGEIQIVHDKTKLAEIHKLHYAKNPDAEQYKNDPATIFLKFTPNWFRYTDYNTEPPAIITS